MRTRAVSKLISEGRKGNEKQRKERKQKEGKEKNTFPLWNLDIYPSALGHYILKIPNIKKVIVKVYYCATL